MVSLKSFLINFLLGGTIVSVASLIGSQGRGLLAAFVATFPTMTVLTFSMIYRTSGYTPTVNYAKGLLLMTPPWIVYVLCLIFLLPRCGFAKALIIGIVAYMALAGVASMVMKHLK